MIGDVPMRQHTSSGCCVRLRLQSEGIRAAVDATVAKLGSLDILVNKSGLLPEVQTLRKTVDNFLGSYTRPMTDQQMAMKYRRLVARTLSPENVEELEAIIRSLETMPSVAPQSPRPV
jgi:NAD(P)-dependent dehydrogenase (short-subunit alcohol dehydrogenase family)